MTHVPSAHAACVPVCDGPLCTTLFLVPPQCLTRLEALTSRKELLAAYWNSAMARSFTIGEPTEECTLTGFSHAFLSFTG
jgi:hypothetical protein